MVSPKWAEPTFGHLFNFEFSIAGKDEIGTYFHNPEPHLHLPPKSDILVISISYSPNAELVAARVVPAPRPPLPQLRHYWRPGCCRCFRLPCALAYPFSQQRRRFQFLSPCWDHTVGTYVSLPPSRLWYVVACLHRPPQPERQQQQKKNISYYSKRNPRFQKYETIVVISIDFLVWNWKVKNRRVLSPRIDVIVRESVRICIL
jgi:hypothetical protein